MNLADALSIVLLMAAKRDPAYERAAAKWLIRFARERPHAGLDDLKTALDALLLLRDGRTQAHDALRMLAGRQRLGDVIGLTDPPPNAQQLHYPAWATAAPLPLERPPITLSAAIASRESAWCLR